MTLRLLLLLCALAAPPVFAADVDYGEVTDVLVERGDALVADYTPDRSQDTAAGFTDLYFKVFEASGMEMALGALDAGRLKAMEADFGAVVSDAMRGQPKESLSSRWQKLRVQLLAVRGELADRDASFATVVFKSFVILLREGFEAMLVIGALVAYLRRVGAGERVRQIHIGAMAGLIASAVSAFVLMRLMQGSGAAREAIEGITLLFASGVLFYVSYWLFSKREAARWHEYVEGQMRAALNRGSMLALSFAAFLAVYREGAETVLFYNALAAGHSTQMPAIGAGIVAATVALAAIYFLMRTASVRLPFGLFFGGTAGLLYALAVVFAGQGVLELQSAGVVSATPASGVPTVAGLGVFPTWEGLAAQGLLLLALLPAAWQATRPPRAQTAVAAE